LNTSYFDEQINVALAKLDELVGWGKVQHFGWFKIPSRRSFSEPVHFLDSTPTNPTYI